jgi:hypothetical protein
VYSNCADAAAALVSFGKQPAHAKLLLRPLPAKPTTQQATALTCCNKLSCILVSAVERAEATRQQLQQDGLESLSAQLLLESTFAAQPVATLARLLVWMQKQQELLQLPSLDAQMAKEAASSSSSSSSSSSNDAIQLPYSMVWQASAYGGCLNTQIHYIQCSFW